MLCWMAQLLARVASPAADNGDIGETPAAPCRWVSCCFSWNSLPACLSRQGASLSSEDEDEVEMVLVLLEGDRGSESAVVLTVASNLAGGGAGMVSSDIVRWVRSNGGTAAAFWARLARIHGRIASNPSGVQWMAPQSESLGHDIPCMKGRHSAAWSGFRCRCSLRAARTLRRAIAPSVGHKNLMPTEYVCPSIGCSTRMHLAAPRGWGLIALEGD